ncbi:MAG TPA: sigma-70 family RNA polymerase sigma factor [Acidobacteriaceae bacterium]|nr:sigma-70 family RNA polymerase sigma factor [Acidobacteriaceae bacterium]
MPAEPAEAQNMSDTFLAHAHDEMISLISERLPYFRRIALRRLDNVADAEDAVQTAFLSAWKNLDQFRGQAQMSTWLTAIVINSARLVVRKRPRLLHLPLEHEDDRGNRISETLSDTKPDPETQVLRLELEHRLRRLSIHLSPGLRAVYRLRTIEGLSVQETATALGLTVSAVKTRAARAREQLRLLDESQPAEVAAPTGPRHMRRRRRRKPHG